MHVRASESTHPRPDVRVLLGELAPDAGTVVIGKNSRVAYYDQQRAQQRGRDAPRGNFVQG